MAASLDARPRVAAQQDSNYGNVENPFTKEAPTIQSHPRGGKRDTSHGNTYQLHHTILWLHRLYKSGCSFEVSVEDSRAGKFDDFVVRTERDGVSTLDCIQVKPTFSKKAKIGMKDLMLTFEQQNKSQNTNNNTTTLLSFKKKEKTKFNSRNILGRLKKCQSGFDLREHYNSLLKCKDQSFLESTIPKRFIFFTNRKWESYGSDGEKILADEIFDEVQDDFMLQEILYKFKDEFKYRSLLLIFLIEGVDEREEPIISAEEFLNNVYFAVGQKNLLETEKLVKSEIREDFENIPTAFDDIHTCVASWYETRQNEIGLILNEVDIKKFFESLKIHNEETQI